MQTYAAIKNAVGSHSGPFSNLLNANDKATVTTEAIKNPTHNFL